MFCPKCGSQNQDTNRFCKKCGRQLPERSKIRQAAPLGLVGQLLEGKYRIDARLGSGGMGDVYKATRLLIGDTVAIKVLHGHLAADPQAAERFRREAVTATKLRHKNVVTIFDVGVASGSPYILMELAEGHSLRQVIEEYKVLPLDFAVTVAAQVCAALDEAHRLGIVHRDVKPENIIANRTSSGWQIKILDFGIAKLYGQGEQGLTLDGNAMGTPQYMSPEQCMGEQLDGRSDIYSVGIVLYELLCGTVPFKSPSASAVAIYQVQNQPPPPTSLNPDIHPQIEEVLLRSLSKRPEDRQQTPGQLSKQFIEAATLAFRSGHTAVSATPIAQPNVTPDFVSVDVPKEGPSNEDESADLTTNSALGEPTAFLNETIEFEAVASSETDDEAQRDVPATAGVTDEEAVETTVGSFGVSEGTLDAPAPSPTPEVISEVLEVTEPERPFTGADPEADPAMEKADNENAAAVDTIQGKLDDTSGDLEPPNGVVSNSPLTTDGLAAQGPVANERSESVEVVHPNRPTAEAIVYGSDEISRPEIPLESPDDSVREPKRKGRKTLVGNKGRRAKSEMPASEPASDKLSTVVVPDFEMDLVLQGAEKLLDEILSTDSVNLVPKEDYGLEKLKESEPDIATGGSNSNTIDLETPKAVEKVQVENGDPTATASTRTTTAVEKAPELTLDVAGYRGFARFRRNLIGRWSVIGGCGFLVLMIIGGVGYYLWELSQSPDSTQSATTSSEKTSPQPPAGMAYVPGGEFEMGDDNGPDRARPAHKVTVGPFFMDLNEVTNEDYKKFIDAAGQKPPSHWKNGTFPAGQERFPVNNVNWDEANAYASWKGKRLPTEQEWEFAARGPEGRKYPWGDTWKPGMSNAGPGRIREVGSSEGRSPFGMADMTGNVWEWTANDYAKYPGSKMIDDVGEYKVIRGGCHVSTREEAVATRRAPWPPRGSEQGYKDTGFRCALDIPKEK